MRYISYTSVWGNKNWLEEHRRRLKYPQQPDQDEKARAMRLEQLEAVNQELDKYDDIDRQKLVDENRRRAECREMVYFIVKVCLCLLFIIAIICLIGWLAYIQANRK